MTPPDSVSFTLRNSYGPANIYPVRFPGSVSSTELTFILLSGAALRDAGAGAGGDVVLPELLAGQPMIGDVNLFLKGHPDDEDFEAEVEIMIAGACVPPVHTEC